MHVNNTYSFSAVCIYAKQRRPNGRTQTSCNFGIQIWKWKSELVSWDLNYVEGSQMAKQLVEWNEYLLITKLLLTEA